MNMLKTLKTTFALAMGIGLASFSYAQKTIKEGTITYSAEYTLPADQQSLAAMLPKEMKVAFNGDLSRMKMDMGMYATTILANIVTGEMLTLTEVPMQNRKIAVKMNKAQAEKMREFQNGNHDYDVTATTETKKIAGYNCKKYILKDREDGTQAEIWTTTEIKIPNNALTSELKKVDGVPVEFSNKANGLTTKMTLKSIDETPVGTISLEAPSDYEPMDFTDLMSQMGG
ncbi:hypothetical protein BCY91_07550 [Pelobium manganitolerans]|uniref:DUF4412 domain-containing protein n=1 Tax=Pelobium manganitolerans TaxID=1842495 RepID=A0A419S3X9_9SPHI|nr:DUF4412 domain-containing protein [Pelobium manganitolerans]RKD14332.1 hypothetical protein BCY91_07550 [Pelobium manganitolerans]